MGLNLGSLCPLLQVFDMLESVRFYRQHLGFEIDRQSPARHEPYEHFDWALRKRGDLALMLNTAYEADRRPAARETARTVAHDDTRLYFGCPDVDDAYRILRSQGLELDEPLVAPYGKDYVNAALRGLEIPARAASRQIETAVTRQEAI